MENKQSKHWAERPIVRWIANIIAIAAVAALIFVAWQKVIAGPKTPPPTESTSNTVTTSTDTPIQVPQTSNDINLGTIDSEVKEPNSGISRAIDFQTIIPSRPRVDVTTYEVKQGDTLFEIAESYGIKPETLLWGNFEVLEDNPHLLKPAQVLNILPTDGVYYQWKEGDTPDRVAQEFKTDAKSILEYAGNRFDLTNISQGTVEIPAGTWVIVPGGKRPIKDWGPPAITRSNPASARYYGEGSCGSVYEGAVGTGTYVWPTAYHGVSGYGYSEIHRAIDLGGAMGDAIFAADSGVVVFAGWSNFGYGNLLVIDHGFGNQTAYAHLSAVAVTCGQSVFQGGYIGAMGSTGNSTGPHLHFEVIYGGAKINPLSVLP
jgi:murein DD-endopeptidase MepM/ murein hydrolase activator NlpD